MVRPWPYWPHRFLRPWMGLCKVVRGAGRNVSDGCHTSGVTIRYLLPINHRETPMDADVVPVDRLYSLSATFSTQHFSGSRSCGQ